MHVARYFLCFGFGSGLTSKLSLLDDPKSDFVIPQTYRSKSRILESGYNHDPKSYPSTY